MATTAFSINKGDEPKLRNALVQLALKKGFNLACPGVHGPEQGKPPGIYGAIRFYSDPKNDDLSIAQEIISYPLSQAKPNPQQHEYDSYMRLMGLLDQIRADAFKEFTGKVLAGAYQKFRASPIAQAAAFETCLQELKRNQVKLEGYKNSEELLRGYGAGVGAKLAELPCFPRLNTPVTKIEGSDVGALWVHLFFLSKGLEADVMTKILGQVNNSGTPDGASGVEKSPESRSAQAPFVDKLAAGQLPKVDRTAQLAQLLAGLGAVFQTLGGLEERRGKETQELLEEITRLKGAIKQDIGVEEFAYIDRALDQGPEEQGAKTALQVEFDQEVRRPLDKFTDDVKTIMQVRIVPLKPKFKQEISDVEATLAPLLEGVGDYMTGMGDEIVLEELPGLKVSVRSIFQEHAKTATERFTTDIASVQQEFNSGTLDLAGAKVEMNRVYASVVLLAKTAAQTEMRRVARTLTEHVIELQTKFIAQYSPPQPAPA